MKDFLNQQCYSSSYYLIYTTLLFRHKHYLTVDEKLGANSCVTKKYYSKTIAYIISKIVKFHLYQSNNYI